MTAKQSPPFLFSLPVASFTIDGRLDALNDYVKACRANRYGANVMKKRNESQINTAIIRDGVKPVQRYPVKIQITWNEKNKKRDVDNVGFAVKFILDALVKAGILENDGQKQVCGIEHVFNVDPKNPRIEVKIFESENAK